MKRTAITLVVAVFVSILAGCDTILPPGSEFPSAAHCENVAGDRPEARPQNTTANHTVVNVSLPNHPDFDATWQSQYKSRITGSFTGTTEELFFYYSCKWGLSSRWLKAQAWQESNWVQAAEGDFESASRGHCTPGDTRNPCPTSFGILQNKWYFNPGSWPYIKTSTPWHLDFSMAKLRGCYDGHKFVDGPLRPAGDWEGCLGNWFSGSWHDPGAEAYVDQVTAHYQNQPWL